MADRTRQFKAIVVVVTLAIVAVLALAIRQRQKTRMPGLHAQKYEFLSEQPDWYVADPVVGFVHPAFARRLYEWPEHPLGRFELTTNNLGLREDRETLEQKPAGLKRYLVVGDSHIDGVIPNAESFPNQWEADLVQAHPDQAFEVLNAGTGMYGPHQYARTLEKRRGLRPEVFVVVVYTGNDFLDALAYGPDYDAVRQPPGYFDTLARAVEIDAPAVSQALNQAYFFKIHPEMKQVALRRTFEQLELIAKVCEEDDIRVYVVLLPTKLELEWHDDADRLNRVSRFLGLSEADLRTNAELGAELGKWLATQGIPFLDASVELRKPGRPVFWRRDYHLSALGHRTLASSFISKFGLRP